MNRELIRAALTQVLDPAYADMAQDVLTLRATAADEGEDPGVRLDAQERAEAAFDALVDAITAEVPARELVDA